MNLSDVKQSLVHNASGYYSFKRIAKIDFFRTKQNDDDDNNDYDDDDNEDEEEYVQQKEQQLQQNQTIDKNILTKKTPVPSQTNHKMGKNGEMYSETA